MIDLSVNSVSLFHGELVWFITAISTANQLDWYLDQLAQTERQQTHSCIMIYFHEFHTNRT